MYHFLRDQKSQINGNETIQEALKPLNDKHFVDLDPLFNVNIDEDF